MTTDDVLYLLLIKPEAAVKHILMLYPRSSAHSYCHILHRILYMSPATFSQTASTMLPCDRSSKYCITLESKH